MRYRFQVSYLRPWVVLAALAILPGCGAFSPGVHEVRGKVELTGGNVQVLAGGKVEAVLVDDRRVVASGEILPDGSFTLQSGSGGTEVSGTREGEYQVRLILSDEDSGHRLRKGVVLAPRYSKFGSSGLALKVPSEEVTLKVSTK